MLGVIREAKRVIQVNNIQYCPNLFKAIIMKPNHPTEHDESDDIELMKKKNLPSKTHSTADHLSYSSNSSLQIPSAYRFTDSTHSSC